jgi:hypothetical protein
MVSALIERVDRWLAANRPEYYTRLQWYVATKSEAPSRRKRPGKFVFASDGLGPTRAWNLHLAI